ncbi:MAG: hypothetical protein Q9220_002121 [cf. Caloplaca sp. 1 TL-2023]
MSFLENHLEQISLSAAAIAELPFPPPKKFTNAILRSHDITALIRDTELHERSLFKFAPPEPNAIPNHEGLPRRSTAYGPEGGGQQSMNGYKHSRPPPQRSAVATLLGKELGDQLRLESIQAGKERGEVDVDLLLRGAEKLTRVAKHTAQLAKMNRRGDSEATEDLASPEEPADVDDGKVVINVSAGDLEREEREIRELEKKKQALEDRVSGMERDLGGLLR